MSRAGLGGSDGRRGVWGGGPAVHRRRLRIELRNARETAGLTQRDAAAAMNWSPSKLMRIELGAFNISRADLRELLEFYAVGPARTAELLTLTGGARSPERWSMYRSVAGPRYLTFIEYEQSAVALRGFEPLLVPGLLQTEDYARAVLCAIEGGPSERVESLVDLCYERQEILQESGRGFHFVLDEAVLRRVVGGPEVTRKQLIWLQELAGYPNVTIGVVPFSAGLYPMLWWPFTVFTLPDSGDGDVLCLGNSLGELVVRENASQRDARHRPAGYLGFFQELVALAGTVDFPDLVDALLTELPKTRTARPGRIHLDPHRPGRPSTRRP
jgi:transcriptional regulator with XRE-family HTH domain